MARVSPERKKVRQLANLLSADVRDRYWGRDELKAYLKQVCADAGLELLGDFRLTSTGGDSSVRARYPGGSERYWIRIVYGVSPGHDPQTGKIYATATLTHY